MQLLRKTTALREGNPPENPMEEYGQQEYAFCGDFDQFQIQQRDEQLQHSDNGDATMDAMQKRTVGRAKRTRRIYLPEMACNMANSPCHRKPSNVVPFPSASSLKFAKSASSKSTECGSSAAPCLEDSDSGVSESLGDVSKRRKSKLKGDSFNFQKLPNSAFADNGLRIISSYSDSLHMDQQSVGETTLVDVHLTVEASYRAENAPFVCLTSEFNGTTILGYPLEIGELHNYREMKERIARKPSDDDKGSGIQRLTWTTSKRTPVCYVANSLHSFVSRYAIANPIKEDDLLVKEGSTAKKAKQGGREVAGSICVPVKLVFRKVLAAVGQVRS